jgi:hypothetical protein
MWRVLGASVDFMHATLMVAWVVGLPLLFWHRWPRATRAYAAFAIAFVLVNVVSRAILGECVLTTIARACWERAPRPTDVRPISREWFTVRIAEAIFRLTPTHRSITIVSEALITVTAVGMLVSLHHGARATHTASSPNATTKSRIAKMR